MARRKTYTTDEMHFAVFKETAEFFIDALGLQHWQVAYHHIDNPEMASSRAYIRSSTDIGQQASIVLTKTWGHDEPTMYKVMLAAYHEVHHMLLGTMYNVALYDEMTPEQRDRAYRRAEHEVIRRMEKVVFPLFMKRLAEHLQKKVQGLDHVGSKSDM